MKRVWIVCAVVGLILVSSTAALFHLFYVSNGMERSLAEISEAIEQEDYSRAAQLTDRFQAEWEHNEAMMTRYIHHDELDSITGTVARLSALVQHGDIPEYAAEIKRLQHLIRHIRDAEIPSLRNIL